MRWPRLPEESDEDCARAARSQVKYIKRENRIHDIDVMAQRQLHRDGGAHSTESFEEMQT
eukprot:8379874-Pyramimonas_sp.AAC.1